jgi:hypothetical protein
VLVALPFDSEDEVRSSVTSINFYKGSYNFTYHKIIGLPSKYSCHLMLVQKVKLSLYQAVEAYGVVRC